LQHNLISHQALFSKSQPINKAKAATFASYKIIQILAKKKPFEDGNMTAERLVVTGDCS
jgi:hypothetical protein